jgi:hypothetical protein
MRPKAPQFLIDWQHYLEKKRGGPPKCCHSCDYYDENGKCEKFDAEPPVEFLGTENACDVWLEVIPF